MVLDTQHVLPVDIGGGGGKVDVVMVVLQIEQGSVTVVCDTTFGHLSVP